RVGWRRAVSHRGVSLVARTCRACRSDWRHRRRAARGRPCSSAAAEVPERGLVEVLARARVCERARAADDSVRRRARASVGDLAPARQGSARTPARTVDRMVAVPGALSRSAALRAHVLTEVDMGKSRVLSEFWQFLRQEKKYWLVPIVIVFVLFGLLIVFSQSSAVAPFIYTLF